MGTPATYELDVRFYELDPYGHVNHATYLQYFEAARVDWLNNAGCGLDRLLDDQVQLVVVNVATRFMRPAHLGDSLQIETGLIRSRRASSQWGQVARRYGEVIASQRVNFAATNAEGRPCRTPANLSAAVEAIDVGPDWLADVLPALRL